MNYNSKRLFYLTLVLACGLSLNASDWKTSGDIRAGYVRYGLNNPPPGLSSINKGSTDSHGFYTTPKVSVLTPTFNNFSIKTTIAGATDFGINNPDYENKNFVFNSTDKQSFAILQELFLSYNNNSHNLSIGRQEIVTPLVEADDYYFLANSYEVVNYINSSVDNTKFHLGYFHKMSGVWDSGANGEEFHSMSDASFVAQADKDNASDSGILYGAVEYEDEKQKIKAWEYYIEDLYNMLQLQYDYSSRIDSFSYDLGIQFTNYKELGKLASNNFTNIEYSIYSAKFDGQFENGVNFATGVTKYTDGEGQSATLGAYGGFPSFTYGLVYSYFTMGSLQNAGVYKAELGYDLGKIGLKNTSIKYRYTYYDLDSTYSKTAVTNKPQDEMHLNGIKISYSTEVGTYISATYELRDLDNEPDTSAFRLIGGYRF